jgi:hypothetical protein
MSYSGNMTINIEAGKHSYGLHKAARCISTFIDTSSIDASSNKQAMKTRRC